MLDKKKILIAEDEVTLRELFVETLGSEGFVTVGVADGQEAYEKLTVDKYDMLLLDILMPRLNGLELLAKLQSEDKLKLVPSIVMLTNLADDVKIAQALQYGVRGYMIKSAYTPDTLVAEVKKYLQS